MDPSEPTTDGRSEATDGHPEPNVFEGRYPDLPELVQFGGKPGLEYALIAGQNIARFQGLGWQLVRGLGAYLVRGPGGEASANLMCLGQPIPGANPANGIRPYWIDPTLDKLTGLTPEGEPSGNQEGKGKGSQGKAKGEQGHAGVPSGAPA